MFPLLIKSFLPRGSNEISATVALGHCFLAEIPGSSIPLTSSSGVLWSRLFVPERMKIYLRPELLEKFKFCILHNTCEILSPCKPKFKVLWREKTFFQISGYLPKVEITEPPISNIFADYWFSKLFWSLKFLFQPGLPILEVGIKCDVSIKSWSI